MSTSLCHNDDEAPPGPIFHNVSLKIGKINSAVLSPLSSPSRTRYSGMGGADGSTQPASRGHLHKF